MKRVKVGMLSFAHVHANHYFDVLIEREDVEIVGISDENESRVAGLLETYAIPYFENYSDLLQTDADLIIINSENAFHAEHTIAAAQAKKHVLCEKPLGINEKEMKAMIHACRDNDVELMTAFANRYIPSIIEARKMIQAGQLGEIIAVKATNQGAMPGGWFIDNELSGGGAMLDHTVHVADLLNWILQSPIQKVYAENGTLIYPDLATDDAGMVCMKFKNGVIATLDTSWSRVDAYPYKRDLTMHFIGTKGMLMIDYFKQISKVYSNQLPHAEWSYWGDDKNILLIDDVIERLKANEKFAITGEDGLAASKIAIAAYKSVELGQVVKQS